MSRHVAPAEPLARGEMRARKKNAFWAGSDGDAGWPEEQAHLSMGQEGLTPPNWLSNRVFKSFDDIVDHRCYAWNTLIDQPWKIMSIANREWATVGQSL
jgi:hypothetical protein